MLRIFFTIGDLARLRMITDLGPLAETAFALNLLAHADNMTALAGGSRARLRAELPGLERLVRAHRDLPNYLDRLPVGPDAPTGSGPTRPPDPGQAEFCARVVLPRWDDIHAYLEQVRQTKGRILVAGGLEQLLSSLHPKLHWNPPALELHQGPDRDVHLAGGGLLLSPSLLLHGRSCLFVRDAGGGQGPALVFPVDATMREDHARGGGDEQALGDLVGHTRAAALHALTSAATTGELAHRLGLSLAGASKHAAVLRGAGLVSTIRERNTALHSLTGLGRALLLRRGILSRDQISAPLGNGTGVTRPA